MSRDENDGGVDTGFDQFTLKLKAANRRDSHVKNQATGPIVGCALQEISRCRERFSSQPHALQQALHPGAHTRISVDDKDDRSRGTHALSASSFGKVKQNFAPCPELAVAHKRPPCDSTIERLIARPIPVP